MTTATLLPLIMTWSLKLLLHDNARAAMTASRVGQFEGAKSGVGRYTVTNRAQVNGWSSFYFLRQFWGVAAP